MFLVPKEIYEKLVTSIDERDKKHLENLNQNEIGNGNGAFPNIPPPPQGVPNPNSSSDSSSSSSSTSSSSSSSQSPPESPQHQPHNNQSPMPTSSSSYSSSEDNDPDYVPPRSYVVGRRVNHHYASDSSESNTVRNQSSNSGSDSNDVFMSVDGSFTPNPDITMNASTPHNQSVSEGMRNLLMSAKVQTTQQIPQAIEGFRCGSCEDIFTSERERDSHQSTHNGKNRFTDKNKCGMCNDKFNDSEERDFHQLTHSKKMTSTPLGSVRGDNSDHSESFIPFQCRACKMEIFSDIARTFHERKCKILIKKFEGGEVPSAGNESNTFIPFKCIVCEKEILSKADRNHHERSCKALVRNIRKKKTVKNAKLESWVKPMRKRKIVKSKKFPGELSERTESSSADRSVNVISQPSTSAGGDDLIHFRSTQAIVPNLPNVSRGSDQVVPNLDQQSLNRLSLYRNHGDRSSLREPAQINTSTVSFKPSKALTQSVNPNEISVFQFNAPSNPKKLAKVNVGSFKGVFKCKMCLASFKKESGLCRHLKNIHKVDKNYAPTLPQGIKRKISEAKLPDRKKKKILKPNEPIKCGLCIMSFKVEKAFERHMLNMHNSTKDGISLSTQGVKRKSAASNLYNKANEKILAKFVYSCRICNSTFAKKNTLKRHLNNIHQCNEQYASLEPQGQKRKGLQSQKPNKKKKMYESWV